MAEAIEQSSLATPAAAPSHYLSREMSWLAFNERVLEEAADAAWPLLERLKFLAIFHSNLDEFFMIRVSGLHGQLAVPAIDKSPDGLTPIEQLERIGVAVRRLVGAAALVLRALLPELAKAGVRLRDWESLEADVQVRARNYFRTAVLPVLTPLAVDPGHPFPFISNLSLSLAVEIQDPEGRQRRFARVKVPEILPRFIPLQTLAGLETAEYDFLPLEQLIAANLEALFPGMKVLSVHPFRITRDMDMDVLEEEAHDLLAAIDREVRKRKFGATVRLEVDPATPPAIRDYLLGKLLIDPEDLYETPGPLGAASLMALSALPIAELRDAPFTPAVQRGLSEDPFAAIRQGDVLLHHPYDSFAPVLTFLRKAAEDPAVLAIKMTLYRTGSNPELVKSLILAAENGKQVAVAIELKARFDEQNNIERARALERAGIHVFYGSAGIKIHGKLTLVVRREGEALRRYVHLSTGNYNATTSRLYTDVGLLTCDPDLGEDASELFNSLSGYSRPRYRKLAVAPQTLASTVLAKINEQADRARAGKPGRIFAKLNALVDAKVIEALYSASRAGVQIDLVIRGICCLRPGVKGLSENIRVSSIVGRFLEHSRVLVFGPPGDEQLFLSSADWMPRNLYRRVELLIPVLQEAVRERLRREIVEPALRDNCRARDLDERGAYHRRKPKAGEPARDAQLEAMNAPARNGLHSAKSSAASNGEPSG